MIEMRHEWTPEEIKVNRKAWVDLLRSGQLKQGQYRLCSEDKNGKRCYCVWGVACKVFGDTFSKPCRSATVLDDNTVYDSDFKTKHSDDVEVMPIQVARAMGLFSPPLTRIDEVILPRHGFISTLWIMNDDGTTFEELADIIEANKFTKSVI